MTPQLPYEVLGIGPAIMDSLIRVSEDFLRAVPGIKHGMQRIDYPTFNALLKASRQQPQVIAGGSSSNTLKGLASIGHKCAFLGAVGTDDKAAAFQSSLHSYGITALLKEKDLPTSQVLGLIDPHGHRTFRTYIGATALLTPADLLPDHFVGPRLVHIAGYMLHTPDIVSTAMQRAKEGGAKVSFDLSSHEIVSQYHHQILELIEKHADLVFCNEDEAIALSRTTVEAGCHLLSEISEIAIVSRGRLGCLIANASKVEAFPAYPAEAIDTTGAGDYFAAGFIHGYLQGKSLAECAHYGALLGNAVVQSVGAEIPKALWPTIRRKIGLT